MSGDADTSWRSRFSRPNWQGKVTIFFTSFIVVTVFVPFKNNSRVQHKTWRQYCFWLFWDAAFLVLRKRQENNYRCSGENGQTCNDDCVAMVRRSNVKNLLLSFLAFKSLKFLFRSCDVLFFNFFFQPFTSVSWIQ